MGFQSACTGLSSDGAFSPSCSFRADKASRVKAASCFARDIERTLTDDNGHERTCRQHSLPTLPRLNIAKLSVNNPTSIMDPQSSFLPLESTGQSYTGESIAPRKRVVPNFIYTVRNGNAGEFAPPKRAVTNFSYAVGNDIVAG